MKIKKLLFIISFAMIVALTVCIFSLTVGAETFNGVCGEKVAWSLDTETGVLAITGEGEMSATYPMPWYLCTQYITKVTVGDGVTAICDEAFEDCDILSEIVLSDTVVSIGGNVFANTAIKTLTCTCLNSYVPQYARENALESNIIHSFGEWVTTKPTTKAPGKIERECSACHTKETTVIPQLVNKFKDVPDISWYTESALWCEAQGYMSGTSSNGFSPNSPLTRAHFVQIISKIAGADLNSVKYRAAFTDVPDGKWFTKAVIWASDNGITGGIGSGLFGVDNRVTRQELAVFLRTYAVKCGKDVSKTANISGYKDYADVGNWAKTPLAWAIGTGIMKDTTSTTLSPTITATRAQVSVIIKLFCEGILG